MERFSARCALFDPKEGDAQAIRRALLTAEFIAGRIEGERYLELLAEIESLALDRPGR